MAAYGDALIRNRQFSEAVRVLGECLEMRTELFPDDWENFEVQSLFGEALSYQGKRDESQSLLTTGYEGLKERSDKIPCYLRRTVVGKAADRLLSLANNQQDDIFIAKWCAEIEDLDAIETDAKKKRP